jgi:hypothetical protein
MNQNQKGFFSLKSGRLYPIIHEIMLHCKVKKNKLLYGTMRYVLVFEPAICWFKFITVGTNYGDKNHPCYSTVVDTFSRYLYAINITC